MPEASLHALSAITGLHSQAETPDSGFWLTHEQDRLVLRGIVEGRVQTTAVDFSDPALLHRLRTSGKHQGIGQAVGLNRHAAVSVLDCTAGLGRDAFVLAGLGCRVTLLERHPVVHALLADGLRRAMAGDDVQVREICSRMSLHRASGHDWLATLGDAPDTECLDVVYLDPMFPERGKSARVKKDMEGLQHVVGPDTDILPLVDLARRAARRRVVVKRPRSRDLSYLEGRLLPAFQLTGKAMQFDVFLPA